MSLELKEPQVLDETAIAIVDSLCAGEHPFERTSDGAPKGREFCTAGDGKIDERLCHKERVLLHTVLTAYRNHVLDEALAVIDAARVNAEQRVERGLTKDQGYDIKRELVAMASVLKACGASVTKLKR